MKCEGCPIGSLFEIVLTGGQGKEGEGCPARHMDCCHLTDTGKRIIKAMLAGEWKCETCKFSPWEGQCSRHVFLTPCIDWQPRDKPCLGESSMGNYFEVLCNVCGFVGLCKEVDEWGCPKCGRTGTGKRVLRDKPCPETWVPCPKCEGTGLHEDPAKGLSCPKCSGTGRVFNRELLKTDKPCPTCHGASMLQDDHWVICPTCHGTGRV